MLTIVKASFWFQVKSQRHSDCSDQYSVLGDVDHAAGNPSQKHSLDLDQDHKLDQSLLNMESRKMTKAGENILRREGRKTMDVAELRSSDEVGRGAGDLDFVIDVTQTEPRSMSLQVIIYPLFPPGSPCFWTFLSILFSIYVKTYHSEPAHINSGYATPVRKGETPTSIRSFFVLCFMCYYYIMYIISGHNCQKGRKSIGRSQSFLGTGVSEERRRHNSLKVTEANNSADDILLIYNWNSYIDSADDILRFIICN